METENEITSQPGMNESTPRSSGMKNLIQSCKKHPIHEEYILNAARDEFRRDTKQFFNETLIQDLKRHKKMHLNKVGKSQLVLKYSETLLGNLKTHHNKFYEDSYIFLAKTRYEIKKLQQDSLSISNEMVKRSEQIRALFKSCNE